MEKPVMSDAQSYDIPRILEEMRADYWRNLEAADTSGTDDRSDYMVISFGNQRFGLPAAACREVLKLPRIVRVPRLPAHLPGVINLRGEIVAVTDLRPLLQLPPEEANSSFRLVVIAEAGQRTALLVERVEGLQAISAQSVATLAEGAPHPFASLFRGKVEDDRGLLMLIDAQRLLARPELTVDQKGLTAAAAE